MLKNITFSAEEHHIEKAREKARKHHTNLNLAFRQWLARYAEEGETSEAYATLMAELDYAESNGAFSREELNAR